MRKQNKFHALSLNKIFMATRRKRKISNKESRDRQKWKYNYCITGNNQNRTRALFLPSPNTRERERNASFFVNLYVQRCYNSHVYIRSTVISITLMYQLKQIPRNYRNGTNAEVGQFREWRGIPFSTTFVFRERARNRRSRR